VQIKLLLGDNPHPTQKKSKKEHTDKKKTILLLCKSHVRAGGACTLTVRMAIKHSDFHVILGCRCFLFNDTMVFIFASVFMTVLCEIQDISCIKDLNALYEAATIEDIYIAYEHLKVDDASLFSCIGVAGVQSDEDALGKSSMSTFLFTAVS